VRLFASIFGWLLGTVMTPVMFPLRYLIDIVDRLQQMVKPKILGKGERLDLRGSLMRQQVYIFKSQLATQFSKVTVSSPHNSSCGIAVKLILDNFHQWTISRIKKQNAEEVRKSDQVSVLLYIYFISVSVSVSISISVVVSVSL